MLQNQIQLKTVLIDDHILWHFSYEYYKIGYNAVMNGAFIRQGLLETETPTSTTQVQQS